MQEKEIAHKSEYEIRGIKYIVTGYYSETSTETLEDKLVRILSDNIIENMKGKKDVRK